MASEGTFWALLERDPKFWVETIWGNACSNTQTEGGGRATRVSGAPSRAQLALESGSFNERRVGRKPHGHSLAAPTGEPGPRSHSRRGCASFAWQDAVAFLRMEVVSR